MTTITPHLFSARVGDLLKSAEAGPNLKVLSVTGDQYSVERTDGFFTKHGGTDDILRLDAESLSWLNGGYSVAARPPVSTFLPASVCDDLIYSEHTPEALTAIVERLRRLKNVGERGAYVTIDSMDAAREIMGVADWVAERIEVEYDDLSDATVGERSRLNAARRVVREMRRYLGE